MRRTVLLLLTAILAALVFARGRIPEPTAEAMADPVWDPASYNVLEMELDPPDETAGSALIAEMSSHFLACRPTAKHEYTGRLAGRDLIVLLAENWRPGEPSGARTPALYRLWQEGVRFEQVYAPDWYQGREGREFALLTGLVPTNVQDLASMSLLAEKDIYLPFSLACSLGRAGYDCRACPAGTGQEAAYAALGFSSVTAGASPEELAAELAGDGPFFLYADLPETDGEAALERLFAALEDGGLADTTAVCLVTGGTEDLRGGLYLWARDLAGLSVPAPCSELDVTPTLLDLFGAGYDARFLAGRDVLADGTEAGPTPPVCLSGSAYSDWVSDAGSYVGAEDAFFPSADRSGGAQTDRRYVLQARQQVYDHYVFSRRILERDYFRLTMGP